MKFWRFTSTLLALTALVFLGIVPTLSSQSVPGAGSVPSASSATGKLIDINSATADQNPARSLTDQACNAA